MKSFILILILSMSFLYISCEKETEEEVVHLSFTEDISPLLSSCASPYCHGSANYIGSVDSHSDFVTMVTNANVLPAIRHEEGYSPMPKGQDKWSDENIALLEKWVAQGMPK